MNKVFNIAKYIILGVCIYGTCRKAYEWGIEYVSEDINNLKYYGNKIIKSINNLFIPRKRNIVCKLRFFIK